MTGYQSLEKKATACCEQVMVCEVIRFAVYDNTGGAAHWSSKQIGSLPSCRLSPPEWKGLGRRGFFNPSVGRGVMPRQSNPGPVCEKNFALPVPCLGLKS